MTIENIDWSALSGAWGDAANAGQALRDLLGDNHLGREAAHKALAAELVYGPAPSALASALLTCILNALDAPRCPCTIEIVDVAQLALRASEPLKLSPALEHQLETLAIRFLSSDVSVREMLLGLVDEIREQGNSIDSFLSKVRAGPLMGPLAREIDWYLSGGFDTTEEYPGTTPARRIIR